MTKTQGHNPTKLLTILAACFVLGGAIGLEATPAIAGQASSAYGYYGDNGRGYQNLAIVSTSAGYAAAYTMVGTTDSSCVPSGWMGARARLFTSGGSLTSQSGILYNSGCVTAFDQATSISSSGTWYSYGVTWGWNGSGYNAHYTFMSPNQSS